MRERVILLLDGDHEALAPAVPLTTSDERLRLAWPCRAARSSFEVAALLGIETRATELPEEDPQLLVGSVLLYRDDDEDATTWLRFGLATVVLARAGVESTEADAWLLAALLAPAAALFERLPPSMVRAVLA